MNCSNRRGASRGVSPRWTWGMGWGCATDGVSCAGAKPQAAQPETRLRGANELHHRHDEGGGGRSGESVIL